MSKKFLKLSFFSTLIVFATGCSTADLQKVNQRIEQINNVIAVPVAGPKPASITPGVVAVATPPVSSSVVTALSIPADEKIKIAVDAALPNIKKIISIHACVRESGGMLQLNHYAVAGVNLYMQYDVHGNGHPNSKQHAPYHDRSKCMSVKSIDNFSMPALNALKFRAVYFADDSGETISFQYLMMRVSDGGWKLQQTHAL